MLEENVEVYKSIIKNLELSKNAENAEDVARTLNDFKLGLFKEHTEAVKYNELNALYDIFDVQSRLAEHLIKGIEKLAEVYENDMYDNMHPKTRQDILWSMHELNLLAKIPLLCKLITVDGIDERLNLNDIVQYALSIDIDENVVKAILQESYEKYGAVDYSHGTCALYCISEVLTVLRLENKLDNIEEPIFELIGDLGKEIANYIVETNNRNAIEDFLHVVGLEHSVLESSFLSDKTVPNSDYIGVADNLEDAIKEFRKKFVE